MQPAQHTRDKMAQVIAEYVSGVDNASPEQDDYELADKVCQLIEAELSKC